MSTEGVRRLIDALQEILDEPRISMRSGSDFYAALLEAEDAALRVVAKAQEGEAPTQQELAAWTQREWGGLAAEALVEESERLTALLGSEFQSVVMERSSVTVLQPGDEDRLVDDSVRIREYGPHPVRWEWEIRSSGRGTFLVAVATGLPEPPEGWDLVGWTAYSPYQVLGSWAGQAGKALKAGREVPKLPGAALVRAWQERPVPGRAEHRPTGIMPLVLGTAQGALFDEGELGRLSAALGPQGGRVEQGHFFSELVSSTALAPWLALVDATGMPIGTRGRGAPLVHRLFVEAQMSVALEDRTRGVGRWLVVPGRAGGAITLREVIEWLYPRGWQRKYLPAVRRGMAQLHNLRVEYDGWEWGLAMFGKLPTATARLDDELEFLVRYLPGSERGPLVDRPQLRLQGLTSAPRWRLYLRLSYLWDEAAGRNGGHRIYATRPVVNRDPEGYILDQNGRRVFVKGKPTKNSFHPRAVRIYDERSRLLTESNPRVDRLPELGPDDLARLAFDEQPLTRDNRRKRAERARKALRGLEAASLVKCFPVAGGGMRVAEVYRGDLPLGHTDPSTRSH